MRRIQLSNSSIKLLLIAAIVLLFLIPVSLIKTLIYDRKNYQREAINSITEPLGRNPEIQGIAIAVPYKKYIESYDAKGTRHIDAETKYVIFAPDSYNLDVEVSPYFLTRGIFKVPVFNGNLSLDSEFNSFDFSYFKIADKDLIMNDAVLILGLSHAKTLAKQPEFKINNKQLNISPIKYNFTSPFTTAVYFNLPGFDASQKLVVSAKLDFQGGENIKLRPLAQNNVFKMKSNWKSPSFSGGWLPKEREITDAGFSAEWNIAGLSTVYPKSWLAENEFKPESINVSFMIPVDSYKKTERSVKYALLFLLIPFIALLISEIFSKTRIHPVQYCLIGFADIIFYLLLLSISEHLNFDFTYLICSLSVCAVTLFYAIAIFKNKKWGFLLSAVQMISYIFLYGTLQAEDYALLIGSIGLFIVLILLMFITRKIDWYELNQKDEIL